jgi:hypothetical protein
MEGTEFVSSGIRGVWLLLALAAACERLRSGRGAEVTCRKEAYGGNRD